MVEGGDPRLEHQEPVVDASGIGGVRDTKTKTKAIAMTVAMHHGAALSA